MADGKPNNPVRLRRRQSDAKWRANVASCYETLKLIIPVNKRASKRQISKAKILEETAKHINFLENILTSLLQEKARKAGSVDAEVDKYVEQRIAAIKQEFVDKLEHKGNVERKLKNRRHKQLETIQQSIAQTAPVRDVLHRRATQGQEQLAPFIKNSHGGPLFGLAIKDQQGTFMRFCNSGEVPLGGPCSFPVRVVPGVGSQVPTAASAHRPTALQPKTRITPVKCMVKSLGSVTARSRPCSAAQSVPDDSPTPRPPPNRTNVIKGSRDAVVPSVGGVGNQIPEQQRKIVRSKRLYVPTNRQLFQMTPERTSGLAGEDLYCHEDMWFSDDDMPIAWRHMEERKYQIKPHCVPNLTRQYANGFSSSAASHEANSRDVTADSSGFDIFREHVTSLLTSKVKATGFGVDLSHDNEISRNIAQLWLQLPDKNRKQFSQLAEELRHMKEDMVDGELRAYLDNLTSDVEISVESLSMTSQSGTREREGKPPEAAQIPHDAKKPMRRDDLQQAKDQGHEAPVEMTRFIDASIKFQHSIRGQESASRGNNCADFDGLDLSLFCEEAGDLDVSSSSTASATSDDSAFSVVPSVKVE